LPKWLGQREQQLIDPALVIGVYLSVFRSTPHIQLLRCARIFGLWRINVTLQPPMQAVATMVHTQSLTRLGFLLTRGKG
jgi:ABC-type amino acid transport system permease subunit